MKGRGLGIVPLCTCCSLLDKLDLSPEEDRGVTLLLRGRPPPPPPPPCVFLNSLIKTSALRRPFLTPAFVMFLSRVPLFFICLFQTLLPFPFLLPFCIP